MRIDYPEVLKTHFAEVLASASAVGAIALAVGILGAGLATANAATQDSSGNCGEVRSQVLAAESRDASDPSRLREARYFANEAKSLCETEHVTEGVAKYRQALSVLEGSSAEATRPAGGQS